MDIEKLVQVTDVDKLLRFHLHCNEFIIRKVLNSRPQKKSLAHGNVDQVVTILNLKGL